MMNSMVTGIPGHATLWPTGTFRYAMARQMSRCSSVGIFGFLSSTGPRRATRVSISSRVRFPASWEHAALKRAFSVIAPRVPLSSLRKEERSITSSVERPTERTVAPRVVSGLSRAVSPTSAPAKRVAMHFSDFRIFRSGRFASEEFMARAAAAALSRRLPSIEPRATASSFCSRSF
eukprot:7383884-Prymnesium_polylepis.1